MMNIPAIICAGDDLNRTLAGKEAIADAAEGRLYIEPDGVTSDRLRTKAKEGHHMKGCLDAFRGRDCISLDGRKISVLANIGSASGAEAALENDADGIGIFRSELLYLHSNDYPTEETQFEEYKAVIEKMAGRIVTIRTLDIGADKRIDYFNLPDEENPALGLRAVRICLERPEIFRTQLRAILRASAFGKTAVMFPFITSLKEVLDCKDMLNSVKRELDKEGIAYDKDIAAGIMIETPAAVLISDLLAKEVDFFSIGTNDLTQYTLAADRGNTRLIRFYNPHHTALLRMIKITADNARKEGIRVGICGEAAADLELTEFFLAVGINEFSVSPPFILPVKAKVCGTDVSRVSLRSFLERND
jgi:phosphotransferase system enzyme I (PtsI)